MWSYMDVVLLLVDQWQTSKNIIVCIISSNQVLSLFVFFVPTGLGDRNVEVRKHMLNAALKAINHHGKVTNIYSFVLPKENNGSFLLCKICFCDVSVTLVLMTLIIVCVRTIHSVLFEKSGWWSVLQLHFPPLCLIVHRLTFSWSQPVCRIFSWHESLA